MTTEFDCNYYIVEFEDGLQLVPKNWLTNEGKEAYWPNYKNFRKYDRAVEEMEDVKDDWETHKICKILGKSDSFQRGKEKLRDAEIYTDLSTDCEEGRKNQRREKAKKRKHSSSSDESYSLDDLEVCVLPFPAAPKSMQEENLLGKSPRLASTPKTKNTSLMELNSNTTPIRKQSVINKGDWITSPMFPKDKLSSSNKGEKDDSAHIILRAISGLNFKLSAIKETQAEIVKRLDHIEKRISEMHVPTNTNQTNNQTSSIVENLQESDNLRSLYPINNDEMMGEVESKLEDPVFKAQIVKEFSKIGGKDVKSIVYNLLLHFFTHSHAQTYSWYGAKGKKVFATLNHATVIQEIVRCRNKEATNTEIEVPVKKWLSKAKERLERGRKQRGNEENNDNEENCTAVNDD